MSSFKVKTLLLNSRHKDSRRKSPSGSWLVAWCQTVFLWQRLCVSLKTMSAQCCPREDCSHKFQWGETLVRFILLYLFFCGLLVVFAFDFPSLRSSPLACSVRPGLSWSLDRRRRSVRQIHQRPLCVSVSGAAAIHHRPSKPPSLSTLIVSLVGSFHMLALSKRWPLALLVSHSAPCGTGG